MNYKKLAFVELFAIAFGFVEAMVVVYARGMLYPNGFSFPLNLLASDKLLFFEWLREIATIVMLFAVAYIAGKNLLQRFSYFLYAFAVWDIFYYIGLKVVLDWPASFFTWDLLFLIPVSWIGPVLAPLIVSLTMIALALLILYLQENFKLKNIHKEEWFLFIAGGFVIFMTFIWDFLKILFTGEFISDFFHLLTNEVFREVVSNFVPSYYAWPYFIVGEILILAGMWLMYRRVS